MKLKKNHVIVTSTLIGFCIILVATLNKGLNLDASSAGNALKDKPAKYFNVGIIQSTPEYSFEKKSSFSLDDLKGKPLVLNFWASWCISCRNQANDLEKFYKKYKSLGVQVVGITIHDTQDAAKGFIDRFGKSYTIGIDIDGKAGINYGVIGVPETLFINAEGIIKHKEVGPVNMKILTEKLALIL